MFRFASAIFLLTVFCCGAAVQQLDKAPAQELVQYVRDAKKAGMKDNRIEEAATKAGWPAPDVKQAIAYVHSYPKADKNSQSKSSNPASASATGNADGSSTNASGMAAPAASVLAASPDVSAAGSRSNPPAANTSAAKPEPAAANPTAATPADPASAPSATPKVTPDPATAAPTAATVADPKGDVKAVDPKAADPNKPADAKPDDAAVGVKPRLNRQSSDEYQIGEGDVVGILVYGEPGASVSSAVVRPDGKISMPLLKDVLVEGLTPPQLEKKITALLEPMFKAPDVTVIMMQNNSKKIYLTGAVRKEGPIPYTYRMTILQALSEGGGVTEYAKRKKIYILRNDGGQQYKYDFDYDAALKGLHMEQNIELQPGDTIVVPH